MRVQGRPGIQYGGFVMAELSVQIGKLQMKNPVMTGFSGNLFKYIRYGAKAIGHILKAQIQSK